MINDHIARERGTTIETEKYPIKARAQTELERVIEKIKHYGKGKSIGFFKTTAKKDRLRANLSVVKQLFLYHWMKLIGETHKINMQILDVNDGSDGHTGGDDEGTLGGEVNTQNKYYLIKSGDTPKNSPTHITALDSPKRGSFSEKK